MSSDLKVSSVETRIGVSAKISELIYRADPSPALGKAIAADPGTRAYRISNPSAEMVAALAEAEQHSAVEPEILKLQITVDVRLRHPEPSSSAFEKTLTDAGSLFLHYLHPWEGPCIGPRAVACYDSSGRPIELVPTAARGLTTVFGEIGRPAHVEMFLHPLEETTTKPSERSLRLILVLGKDACTANSIHDVRSLLAANGRKVFGRYIHLSGTRSSGIGDLNARVKRELGRALARNSGRLQVTKSWGNRAAVRAARLLG